MTTKGPPISLTGSGLRSLSRELADAQDGQIHRVLAVIDGLAERGEADRLVAPLRRRLAELRPPRKLGLGRLLFLPLDPLIVDAARWNSDAPSIPRTALPVMIGQVRDALGADADAVHAVALKLWTDAALARVVDVGAQLWSQAAKVLAEAPPPGNWIARTGLRDRDYTALSKAVSALLGQADSLLHLVIRAKHGEGPEAAELLDPMEAVVPAGSQSVAMMIALAMGWLPRSDQLIRTADDFARKQRDPAMAATVDCAIGFVLTRIEHSPLPSLDLAMAAVDAHRVATMLGDLLLCSQQQPKRRARIEAARRQVDAACRERFAVEIEKQLVSPSSGLSAASDETIWELEAKARELRRFEIAARQIGSPEQYDRQLNGAAEVLRPRPDEDLAARTSRIRLVEILRGPDAAMAMLGPSLASVARCQVKA